ncbi:unnamed protein product [Calypogeia fissa]
MPSNLSRQNRRRITKPGGTGHYYVAMPSTKPSNVCQCFKISVAKRRDIAFSWRKMLLECTLFLECCFRLGPKLPADGSRFRFWCEKV